MATRQTDLSLTQGTSAIDHSILKSKTSYSYYLLLGGMDEHSWALCSDHILRHSKKELFKINSGDASKQINLQEGDLIGVSFDHIQLKFYVNGIELDQSITNIKGTVYPAIYGNLVDR